MLGAYRSRKMKAVGKAATRHVRHVSRLTRKYVSSAAQAPLPHRVMDFSGGQVGVLFLLLILVASIPIWTHPLPPMADYVNHIARMHVIASGAADQKLSQYYQIDWQIVPNLMMDLIIPVLAKGMSVYLAGQIFTVLMFLIIVSGMLAFNRALFGRWSVLPLVAIAAALQPHLSRWPDELLVRHRAGDVGAGLLDLPARARVAFALRGCHGVRRLDLFLPPVRASASTAWG